MLRFTGLSPLDNGLAEIILRPSNIFSEDPLTFHTILSDHALDSPPKDYRARYNQHKDGYKNFEALEPQMIKVLGTGERIDTKTSLVRIWKFGIFTVELSASPYEMQTEAVKKLVKYDTNKFQEILISVKSDHNWVYPNQEFDWLIDAVRADNKSSGAWKFIDPQVAICINSYSHSTHRNTMSLRSALEKNEIVVWKSKDNKYYGMSSYAFTIKFPCKDFEKLILVQLHPGDRAPEGSELGLEITPGSSTYAPRQAIALIHDCFNGLDQISKEVAAFWGLPPRN